MARLITSKRTLDCGSVTLFLTCSVKEGSIIYLTIAGDGCRIDARARSITSCLNMLRWSYWLKISMIDPFWMPYMSVCVRLSLSSTANRSCKL